ncbi:MAG: BrnT family toxin [Spirochaetales bacterium]|nr:BrnT family toxin [Spirochaetales bacterium]
MTFEWDEKKNRKNKAKHAVSFEQAAKAWKDPKRIVFYDEKHSTDEERWIVLGVSGVVLFVVFVEKTEENVRLISARKANNEESKRYYRDYDIR